LWWYGIIELEGLMLELVTFKHHARRILLLLTLIVGVEGAAELISCSFSKKL
jgi:hypothetical protein